MIKKIGIMVFLFCLAWTIFGQNINGYSDLAFGTTLDNFLSEYEGFRSVNPGADLTNKGVVAYRRIDGRFDRGRSVNLLFYENKFYEALVQYINPSSNEISQILRNYVNQYGRPNNEERAGGRYPWVKYIWNINDRFIITAFIQSSLEISHYDPTIKNKIDN